MTNLYCNIPLQLVQEPNWVVWGIEGAPLKAPYTPISLLAGRPLPAKAGVKETWGIYQSAVECVRRGLARGIGYQFDGSGLYGVDLDHVIYEAGQLNPAAAAIVESLDSYTELSPSGTGLHIFVLATDANITRHRKKDGFVEIYTEGRYFTLTGNAYGSVKDIENRSIELQAIHDKHLLPTPAQIPSKRPRPVAVVSGTEQERFLRIGLERDKVFAALWAGERRNGNESADDISLMNKLAYWCNGDAAAMIRAFLSSPYYAQKGEAHKYKCQREDYLPNTADNSCRTSFSTAIADNERWRQNHKRERGQAR